MPKATIVQKDKFGSKSKSIELKVNTNAAATAIADAIDTVTGGSVKAVTRTEEVSDEGGYGTGNLGREAVFQFADTDGKILPFRLRGLAEVYYLQGGTVDITHTDIVALKDAMKTNALLSDGETIDTLVKAYIID
jgi:hypothetical protein